MKKKIFGIIYGLAMLALFILVCGLAEAGKFTGAIILLAILVVAAMPLEKMFPAKNKEEDII